MAAVLLWCVVALLVLGLLSTWLLLYQILRQQRSGRPPTGSFGKCAVPRIV